MSITLVQLVLPRRFHVPLLVLGTLAVFSLTYPGGVLAVYSDASDLPAIYQEMNLLLADAARLEIKALDVRDRIYKKESLIEELIAGRLSLRAVTDRFLAIGSDDEVFLSTIRTHFPGATDEERVARNVLQYTEQRLNSTGKEILVMNRLHAEFRTEFGGFAAAKLKVDDEFHPDMVILAIGENVPDLKTDEAKRKFWDSVSR